MALTRRQKIVRYGLAGILVFLFFLLPPILGLGLRGTVEGKIQAATAATAKLGGLSIHLFPPGATLSDLQLGAPDSAAGNQPLIKISSLRASVSLGTVFGGDLHVTSLRLSGLDANISVSDKGESSFAKFIRDMPQSDRKSPLPIDSLVLRDVRVASWLAMKLAAGVPSGSPNGTLEVAYVAADGLVLPPPGELLGREAWISVAMDRVRLYAPPYEAELLSSGVADGASVRGLALEVAQAANTDSPVRLRRFTIEKPEMATVYTRPGQVPAFSRALAAVQLAMGAAEPPAKSANAPAPSGTGLLIEDLAVSGGRIETRGPDASGKLAYWRLNDLSADAANLAIGPRAKAAAPGQLKVNSASESSSGGGSLSLAGTNITGGYPKWSFECDYRLDNVAAPAFSVVAEEAAKTAIQSGQISMQFAGPAKEGNLLIDGSLTLSQDFALAPAKGMTDISGQIKGGITKAARGTPLKTIRVRGTLENPKISWPDAIAGAMGYVMEQIVTGGPVGVLDTAGTFMKSAVGQGVREATKGVEGASEMIKKLPGADRIFGK